MSTLDTPVAQKFMLVTHNRYLPMNEPLHTLVEGIDTVLNRGRVPMDGTRATRADRHLIYSLFGVHGGP